MKIALKGLPCGLVVKYKSYTFEHLYVLMLPTCWSIKTNLVKALYFLHRIAFRFNLLMYLLTWGKRCYVGL